MGIPPYPQLKKVVLKAVQQHGGEAPISDVERTVADMLGLSDTERSAQHFFGMTKLGYRVAWARFALKREGYLASSKRGVSVLTEKGRAAKVD